MTRPGLPAAAALTAIAAWLSLSTLAVAADGARIGLLPLSLSAVIFTLTAVAAMVALARAGASLAPFALLILVLLPWTPLPAPAALLLWAGEVHWLIWTAVAVIACSTVARRFPLERLPAAVLAAARQKPALVAGVLAFLIFAVSARAVSPSVPGGDEPHYLVITQSLLLDGDIKIENNHRRGDYQAYYAGSLAPHFIRRGRNGEIYSIHAPGLSAFVAPAFAIAGYRGVVLLLLLVSASGSALAWHLAWRASGRRDAAWFGWAAVTLSATTKSAPLRWNAATGPGAHGRGVAPPPLHRVGEHGNRWGRAWPPPPGAWPGGRVGEGMPCGILPAHEETEAVR